MRRSFPASAVAAALGILLLVVAAGGWWWYQAQPGDEIAAEALPKAPSIAVLPFQDLSGDERLSRFPTASQPTSSPIFRPRAF
jgi:hypothetical protein